MLQPDDSEMHDGELLRTPSFQSEGLLDRLFGTPIAAADGIWSTPHFEPSFFRVPTVPAISPTTLQQPVMAVVTRKRKRKLNAVNSEATNLPPPPFKGMLKEPADPSIPRWFVSVSEKDDRRFVWDERCKDKGKMLVICKHPACTNSDQHPDGRSRKYHTVWEFEFPQHFPDEKVWMQELKKKWLHTLRNHRSNHSPSNVAPVDLSAAATSIISPPPSAPTASSLPLASTASPFPLAPVASSLRSASAASSFPLASTVAVAVAQATQMHDDDELNPADPTFALLRVSVGLDPYPWLGDPPDDELLTATLETFMHIGAQRLTCSDLSWLVTDMVYYTLLEAHDLDDQDGLRMSQFLRMLASQAWLLPVLLSRYQTEPAGLVAEWQLITCMLDPNVVDPITARFNFKLFGSCRGAKALATLFQLSDAPEDFAPFILNTFFPLLLQHEGGEQQIRDVLLLCEPKVLQLLHDTLMPLHRPENLVTSRLIELLQQEFGSKLSPDSSWLAELVLPSKQSSEVETSGS